MKKLTAIILTLCLLLGGIAVAEDKTITTNGGSQSTLVTYTVGEDVSFIVTIPAGITMTHISGENSVNGSMSVSLDATDFNVAGRGIKVSLSESANDFNLVAGEESVPYSVYKGGVKLEEGATIIDWSYTADGVKTASADLTLTAAYDATLPAAEYTDTLTFTVTTK